MKLALTVAIAFVVLIICAVAIGTAALPTSTTVALNPPSTFHTIALLGLGLAGFVVVFGGIALVARAIGNAS